MNFTFKIIDQNTARQISKWNYEKPYALYNGTPEDIDSFLNPTNRYFAAYDANKNLAGFCCLGPDGRVPGGQYEAGEPHVVDLGLGLRPDLTGKGMGAVFARSVLDFARQLFPDSDFRITVAAFNIRVFRLTGQLGFEEEFRFESKDKREFVQLRCSMSG